MVLGVGLEYRIWTGAQGLAIRNQEQVRMRVDLWAGAYISYLWKGYVVLWIVLAACVLQVDRSTVGSTLNPGLVDLRRKIWTWSEALGLRLQEKEVIDDSERATCLPEDDAWHVPEGGSYRSLQSLRSRFLLNPGACTHPGIRSGDKLKLQASGNKNKWASWGEKQLVYPSMKAWSRIGARACMLHDGKWMSSLIRVGSGWNLGCAVLRNKFWTGLKA